MHMYGGNCRRFASSDKMRGIRKPHGIPWIRCSLLYAFPFALPSHRLLIFCFAKRKKTNKTFSLTFFFWVLQYKKERRCLSSTEKQKQHNQNQTYFLLTIFKKKRTSKNNSHFWNTSRGMAYGKGKKGYLWGIKLWRRCHPAQWRICNRHSIRTRYMAAGPADETLTVTVTVEPA